jgi:hypothetical protein
MFGFGWFVFYQNSHKTDRRKIKLVDRGDLLDYPHY